MDHFYIVSYKSNLNEYSFGVTEIPFEAFCIGKTVHLFLECYNYKEVIDEIYSKMFKEGNETSEIAKTDISNNILCCDLKKLIRHCIKKIQHLPSKQNIDPSSNITQIQSEVIDISENIDVSGINPIEVKDERWKSFDGLNLKIFQEMSNVNHILNKVQSFKANVAKVNDTLESLRRFKNITGIPSLIQSERPRATSNMKAPVVQETPRGQNEILTLEECKIWMKNKTVNPRTGRKIEENGPTYKRIQMMAKMYKLF